MILNCVFLLVDILNLYLLGKIGKLDKVYCWCFWLYLFGVVSLIKCLRLYVISVFLGKIGLLIV